MAENKGPRAHRTAAYLTSIGMDPNRVVIHEFTNPYSYIEADRDMGTNSWFQWPDDFDWETFRQAYEEDFIEDMDESQGKTWVLPQMHTDLDGVLFYIPRVNVPVLARTEVFPDEIEEAS